MSQPSEKSFLQNAWQQARDMLAREPKKAVVCAALLVVLGSMALKTFVFTGGPAVANAAQEAEADGSAPLPRAISVARGSASDRAARADKLGLWLAKPVEGPGRNLFEFRPENYVSASAAGAGASAGVGSGPDSGRFWDRLAKSITSRADLRRQRQIRTDNVVVAAGKLRVQSTMIQNGVPRVMIEGRLLKAGDSVTVEASAGVKDGAKPSYRIVRVNRQSVVLERDGVRVEVKMTGTDKVRVLSDDE